MKTFNTAVLFTGITIITVLSIGCKKQEEWLNLKNNKSDAVPSTVDDYQALLDNANIMNQTYPAYPYMSADNLVVPYASWQSRTTTERNLYTWASDVYEGGQAFDWNNTYRMIFCANVVLEGIEKLSAGNQNSQLINEVKGAAYFYRAQGLFNLLQEFASPYNYATALSDPGVPVRLNADVNMNPSRSSVEDCYAQVIRDLQLAGQLTPSVPLFQSRPSKPAANALLARTYLYTRDYSKAAAHASASLALTNTLVDFNTLNASSTFPFAAFPGNREVIFYAESSVYTMLIQPNYYVDSTLYRSYALNDLRRTIFYSTGTGGAINFKGQYTAKTNFFAGLAVNELYLISAEAKARLGNVAGAMADLNTLLSKRWKTGTFVPLAASTPDAALSIILIERRKELPFTASSRWSDLRRLNQDIRFASTITRVLNGVTYTLTPNHAKYVLPIPDQEIRITGIPQNPR
jgi:starch-binding outer membrane protein, SusD/RagB family